MRGGLNKPAEHIEFAPVNSRRIIRIDTGVSFVGTDQVRHMDLPNKR